MTTLGATAATTALIALHLSGSCNSSPRSTYAERLAVVASVYERDLERVERILEQVRPRVGITPATSHELHAAASVRRAEMALELARAAIERAVAQTSGDQMRRVAAYSLLALEYANEANAYASPASES